MKKSWLFIVVVLIAVGAAAYMWWPNLTFAPALNQEPVGRIMSIEDYVKQNISALSPEKEVLGGKFYVTDITAGDGKGVVSYEDGHIAFVADFTYVTTEQGHEITSFTIREDI